MSRPASHLYGFGAFRLDTVEHLLLRDGEVVPLAPRLFELLQVLVENSGHLLEKDALMKEVWADAFVEEGSVTRSISALRKVLGESENGHEYIETVPKRGYRFVATVNEVQDGRADVIVEERSTSRFAVEQELEGAVSRHAAEAQQALPEKLLTASRGTWKMAKRRLMPVALTACVSLIGLAVSYFWIWNKPKPIAFGEVRSIAVLPFKPLVAERRDEELELGMADTLITKLSRIRQINVRPISSVRKYAGIDQDPVGAGRELQVDTVLDASYQRDGDRKIRVTARLLRVSDGSAIWAEKFDEQFTTIFLAQDVIAQRVAGALAPRLTGDEKGELSKHYTDNAEAYELYSKGRLFSNRASTEGYWKGLGYFEKAIEKDPDYALAHTGLADSYIRLGSRGLLPPEASWQKKAELAARRAVDIDDTLAEAHVALGNAMLHEWNFSAAETEFKRAVALNPASEEVCYRFSHFLRVVGRFDEALEYAKKARTFNPVSVSANSNLAGALRDAGLIDQAIEQYNQALEMDRNFVPSHANLAWAYAAKAMYEAAIAECKKAIDIDNSPQRRGQLATLGYLYARSGERKEAEKVLDELKGYANYIPPYNFALLYEALGDKEQALACLEKAYGERDIALIALKIRGFNSLRSDPRFVSLLQRIEAASR